MKSIALHNLGCKVNAYEMEVMQQRFAESGYDIVPFDSAADIYLVNTCTVTNIADRKSRQMLHRAKKQNPAAVVVAVGCYVQTGREKVEQDPCVDLAVGNNRKKDIVQIVEAYLAERERKGEAFAVHRPCPEDVIDIGHTAEYEQMQLTRTAEHTRAFIKIQDGCNQFCSYCIIPYARGRVRSRRPQDVLSEVEGLAQKGYREVVITGIHVSSYGMDFETGKKEPEEETPKGILRQRWDSAPLIELLKDVAKIPGIERIRLGSLEPRIVTEEFAEQLAAIPQICPHFHLSLQSGCDATLRRMNRHYTTGEYYEKVEILRRFFDNPAITTDVIVGFPGETEEEFLQTKAFLEKVRFFEMHIFKYSRRKGTAADRLPGQLSERVKQERSARLLILEADQSLQYRSFYIGKRVRILIEEKRIIDGIAYWIGHTENYIKGAIRAEKGGKPNQTAEGYAASLLTDDLLLIE